MSDIAEFRKTLTGDGQLELTPFQKRIVEIFEAGATPVGPGTMRERRPALLCLDEAGAPEWTELATGGPGTSKAALQEIRREPRTAEDFDRRAEMLAARAAALPRHGATYMRMALYDAARNAIAEASRLRAEERALDELRRMKLQEIEKRSQRPSNTGAGIRPHVAGGPNRKARRAERAKWRSGR